MKLISHLFLFAINVFAQQFELESLSKMILLMQLSLNLKCVRPLL